MLCEKLIEKELVENRKTIATNLKFIEENSSPSHNVEAAKGLGESLGCIQALKMAMFLTDDARDAYRAYKEFMQDLREEAKQIEQAYFDKFGDNKFNQVLEDMLSDEPESQTVKEYEQSQSGDSSAE